MRRRESTGWRRRAKMRRTSRFFPSRRVICTWEMSRPALRMCIRAGPVFPSDSQTPLSTVRTASAEISPRMRRS